jgi:hypothetical protein
MTVEGKTMVWKKKSISGATMLKALDRAMAWERKMFVRHVYVPNVYKIVVREAACVLPRTLWDSFCRSAESELSQVAHDERWRIFGKKVSVTIEVSDDIRKPALSVKSEFCKDEPRQAEAGWNSCELALHGNSILIGREDADILLKDKQHRISRHHARISRTGAGYEVRDASSANGTFVNGVPLFGPHLLESGDTLKFADSEFMFVLAEDEAKLVGAMEGSLAS